MDASPFLVVAIGLRRWYNGMQGWYNHMAITLALDVLSIVCVWMFGVPFAWAVAVTAAASLSMLESVLVLADAALLIAAAVEGGDGDGL